MISIGKPKLRIVLNGGRALAPLVARPCAIQLSGQRGCLPVRQAYGCFVSQRTPNVFQIGVHLGEACLHLNGIIRTQRQTD